MPVYWECVQLLSGGFPKELAGANCLAALRRRGVSENSVVWKTLYDSEGTEAFLVGVGLSGN